MPTHQLKKFNHLEIDRILDELELQKEVSEHINPEMSDMEIMAYLIDSAEIDSAIKFLALGLPIREGIWWGHLAAMKAEGDKICVKTQNALKNTAEWVKAPSEERRKSAKKLADTLELATSSSWSSMSVFWSGGSIAPEAQPDLDPEPFLLGHAISNCIVLAAESQEKTADLKKYFLKQGLHVAMGGNGRLE